MKTSPPRASSANTPGALRPVSAATLIRRLRRHFAAQHQVFHVARNARERELWGPYYVCAGRFNVVVDQFRDLEWDARRLGVLAEDEELLACPQCGQQTLTDAPQGGRGHD